jgi:hypothetical protein
LQLCPKLRNFALSNWYLQNMVGVAKRFLLLMFFMYSICHYGQESFKVGREMIGIVKEMSSGNNNEIDKNKTTLNMERTKTISNANLGAQTQETSKNPLACLS